MSVFTNYNNLSEQKVKELEEIRKCAAIGRVLLPKYNANGDYFKYDYADNNELGLKVVGCCYLGAALIGKEGLHSPEYKAPFLHWTVLSHRFWMQTGQDYRGFGVSEQNEIHDEIAIISDTKGHDAADEFVRELININLDRLGLLG